MKSFLAVPVLFLAVHSVMTQERDIAPTQLEAFVLDTAVVVNREELVGRLQSPDSSLVLYAIEAVDRTDPGSMMSGVRIDLATNAWRDSVYLDHARIAELAADIREMARFSDRIDDVNDPRYEDLQWGDRTHGTEACWLGTQRILCPRYTVTNGYEAFSVSAYGQEASYPVGVDQLVELGDLVQRAADTLETELDGAAAEPQRASNADTGSIGTQETRRADEGSPRTSTGQERPGRQDSSSEIASEEPALIPWLLALATLLIVGGAIAALRRRWQPFGP